MTRHEHRQYTRRRFIQAGTTLTALGSAGLATTATAESGTDPGGGVLANGIAIEGSDWVAFFRGFASRYDSVGATPTAATLADRMRNEYQANSEHWLAYGNWLIREVDEVEPMGTVSAGVDVVVTRWIAENERIPTVIEATYDSDAQEYVDLQWRIEEPDEPDFQVEIRNTAAEEAADELQTFRRQYIDEEGDEHSLPDIAYVQELKGKYVPSLRFGEDSKHILELLIGGLE